MKNVLFCLCVSFIQCFCTESYTSVYDIRDKPYIYSTAKKDLDINSCINAQKYLCNVGDPKKEMLKRDNANSTCSSTLMNWVTDGLANLSLGQTPNPNDQRTCVSSPNEKLQYRCVASLVFKFKDAFYGGTGFIVGPRHVLTAAHNIFHHNKDCEAEYASDIEVCFAKTEDKSPYGYQKVIRIYSYTGWTAFKIDEYDMALLVLDEDIGYKIGWLGLMYFENNLAGKEVEVAGYPSRGNESDTKYPNKKMWTMTGKTTNVTEFFLSSSAYTSGGQSGASYTVQDERGNVYSTAVHIQGDEEKHIGVRLTNKKFRDILLWMRESYNVKLLDSPCLQCSCRDFLNVLISIETALTPELRMPLSDIRYQLCNDNADLPLTTISFNKSDIRFESVNNPIEDSVILYIKQSKRELVNLSVWKENIIDILLKKNKSIGDFENLADYFVYCVSGGGFFNHAYSQYVNETIKNAVFHDFIRVNQIILLYILSELNKCYPDASNSQNFSIETFRRYMEDKKEVEKKIIENYKRGSFFLDEARRFWRDNHSESGNRPVCTNYPSIGAFHQERYKPNSANSYLTELYIKLHAEKQKSVVIHGMGGVGKSTLAAQYIKQAAKNKAYDFRGWFDASTLETLRKSYVEAIKEFDDDYVEDPQCTMKKLLNNLKSKFGNKNIHDPLFVFANAPKYKVIPKNAVEGILQKEGVPYDNIFPYLPILSDVGHIIVTTQNTPDPSTDRSYGHFESIHVGVFARQESLAYLQSHFGRHINADERDAYLEQFNRCCDVLFDHPYALRQFANRFLDFYTLSIANLRLVESSIEFKRVVNYKSQIDDASLLESFSASYDRLTQAEKRLFNFLCYLNPKRIDVDCISNILCSYDINEDLWVRTQEIESLGRKNMISLQYEKLELLTCSILPLYQILGKYKINDKDDASLKYTIRQEIINAAKFLLERIIKDTNMEFMMSDFKTILQLHVLFEDFLSLNPTEFQKTAVFDIVGQASKHMVNFMPENLKHEKIKECVLMEIFITNEQYDSLYDVAKNMSTDLFLSDPYYVMRHLSIIMQKIPNLYKYIEKHQRLFKKLTPVHERDIIDTLILILANLSPFDATKSIPNTGDEQTRRSLFFTPEVAENIKARIDALDSKGAYDVLDKIFEYLCSNQYRSKPSIGDELNFFLYEMCRHDWFEAYE